MAEGCACDEPRTRSQHAGSPAAPRHQLASQSVAMKGATSSHFGMWQGGSTWRRYISLMALLLVCSPVMAATSSTSPTTTASSTKATATVRHKHAFSESESQSAGGHNLGGLDDGHSATGTTSGSAATDAARSIEDLGEIGIVGAFRGVSSFTPNGGGATLTLDKGVSSLISLSQNSAALLTSTATDGKVTAACAFYDGDGNISRAFFGGSISAVNSTAVGYVAGIDANGNIDTMKGGVDGPINALFCEQETRQVYVGGNFTNTAAGLTTDVSTLHSSSTGGLAVYNATSQKWNPLSFHGLDGPVFSFTQSREHIYVGGAFTATVDNATHISLSTQPVNLTSCRLTGGNSAELPGFSDPKNIVCTTNTESPGNTWLMRDKLTGYYRIDFPFKTTPSLLRLMNTMFQGRGTKSFRVEAAENNQVLSMSYLDPDTRAEKFCTRSCPLDHNYSWQDFRFVDDSAMLSNITGIIININSWYGEGGGLNKVELYQRDPRVYADNSFNGSPCSMQLFRPSSSITGDWKATTSSSYHGSYLSLTTDVGDIDSQQAQSAEIRLTPNIPESGFYNVYMMVPGCQNTNTCRQRYSASVKLMLNAKHSMIATVAQHNIFDQEVKVYRGYVAASSQFFAPSVVVSLSKNGKIDPEAQKVEVVADSFRFERDTSYTNLNGVLRMFRDQSVSWQMNTSLYKPLNASLPDGAVVRSISADPSQPGVIYIGGEFKNKTQGFQNIVQYSRDGFKPLNNAGVSGAVHSMAFVNSSLFIGGIFNGTGDQQITLNNVAQYSTTEQKWYPLGAGTDDLVSTVVPYSPFGPGAVAFEGTFRTLLASDVTGGSSVTLPSLAIWDAVNGTWTQPPYLHGTPTLIFADQWQDRPQNAALIAGHLSAVAAKQASGTLTLASGKDTQSVERVGYSLSPDSEGRFAVNSGLWYAKKNGTTPRLIVGGKFQTPDGSANVAQLKNGKWHKLVSGITGEVLTINNAANLLFIGGVANMTENPSNQRLTGFSGLSVINMDNGDGFSVQRLQGANNDFSNVRINKVAIRADTSMVIVGGNFQSAGGTLACPYICTLDINEGQWSPLSSSSLVDQVTDMLFCGKKLTVAGTFKNGTNPTSYVMQYDFSKNGWAELPDSSKLPGPITALAAVNHVDSPNAFFIAGTVAGTGAPYLAEFDGSNIIIPDFNIGTKSTIRGITQLPRSRIPASVLTSTSKLSRRSNLPIPSGSVLAVSGDLFLPTGQRASSAFFYNNQWAPFLSTIQDDGSTGYISSIFFENPPTNVYQRHRLSTALVILIAVAIALGITFLIVLIGLVYIYLRNRREAAATASAASAALAAASAGGAATTKAPLNTTAVLNKGSAFGGGGIGGASVALGAGVGVGAIAAAKGRLSDEPPAHAVGARDTWGEDAFGAEHAEFSNVAPKTDRLPSGSPGGLAGLAGVGRKAAVSSETYVHHGEPKGATNADTGPNGDESLDSIFESAAAEAEAEAEAAAAAVTTTTATYEMPTAHHYNGQGNLLDSDTSANAASTALASAATAGAASGAIKKHDVSPDPKSYGSQGIYRPDSTNPFEQRIALRESQGAFPPAGPFADGADVSGIEHMSMPAPYGGSEQATAAALAGATTTGAAAAAAVLSKKSDKDSRRRSLSASTRDTDSSEQYSGSQTASSRPSGESSSAGASSTHLPIRDSLKQYPVFYAKFTFSSRETGELGFRAGERVFVIDQSDEIWWMGIVDHGSDQPLEQGVFPATYVSSTPPKSTEWAELM